MTDQSYSISFTVSQTPEEVFVAINNVRGWWSEEIQGNTETLGEEFNYHYKDLHRCTLRIIELIPNKKVIWHVVTNHFNFTKDETEWTDTDIVFEITEKDGKTTLHFTHEGLVPEYECYSACSDGWGTYIGGSLKKLITTGKGNPNLGEPITESEKVLDK